MGKIYQVSHGHTDSSGVFHWSVEAPAFIHDSDITNYSEIDWEGVNGVLIDDDKNKIIQAGGYTYDRGLFCDLY